MHGYGVELASDGRATILTPLRRARVRIGAGADAEVQVWPGFELAAPVDLLVSNDASTVTLLRPDDAAAPLAVGKIGQWLSVDALRVRVAEAPTSALDSGGSPLRGATFADARLEIEGNGSRLEYAFPREGDSIVVGSSRADADLVFDDAELDGVHLRLRTVNARAVAEPIGAVTLGDEPVTGGVELRHRQTLNVGKLRLTYLCVKELLPSSPPPVKATPTMPPTVASSSPPAVIARPIQPPALAPAVSATPAAARPEASSAAERGKPVSTPATVAKAPRRAGRRLGFAGAAMIVFFLIVTAVLFYVLFVYER